MPVADETRASGSTPATTAPAAGRGLVDALARRDALERDEHTAAILRTRSTVGLGAILWYLFGITDWIVVRYIGVGHLAWYWGLRAAGGVPIILVYLRLRRTPFPSPRAFGYIVDGLYTVACTVVSLIALEFRGLESPYGTGVMLVMLARIYSVSDHWKTGIVRLAPPALAFPITMAVGALFSPAIAAQWRSAPAVAGFVVTIALILSSYLFIVIGSHTIWALRRQVFEARDLGRYRLRQQIGAGGMGEVWAAYHTTLRRDVAVKILRTDLDEEAVLRFEREVRATSELSHPNTVRVFDYGVTEDGLRYFAMELLEGETLAAVVAREGPLAPARAGRIALQAANALAEAHGRGIVHRDVKPQNVFLTTAGPERDIVKLLDFGIARFTRAEPASQLTMTGDVIGTPQYMSPEAASGQPTDARADVYGLGATLYFALTGEPPFRGQGAFELIEAQIAGVVTRPSVRAGRDIPQPLEDVVLRCLAKDPAERYDSAAELAAQLAEALG